MIEYYTLKSSDSIPKNRIEEVFNINCSLQKFKVKLRPLIELQGISKEDNLYYVSIILEYSYSNLEHFHGKEIHKFLKLCKEHDQYILRGKSQFSPNDGGLCSDLWSHSVYRKYWQKSTEIKKTPNNPMEATRNYNND